MTGKCYILQTTEDFMIPVQSWPYCAKINKIMFSRMRDNPNLYETQ